MPARLDAIPVVSSPKDLRQALRKKKIRRIKRLRPLAPSDALIADYLRTLNARFRKIVEAGVKKKILPFLRSLPDVEREDSVERFDAIPSWAIWRNKGGPIEKLARIIGGIHVVWGDVKIVRKIAENMADKIDEKSGTIFGQSIKSVLGIQVELSDKNVGKALPGWVKDNVDLIVTIPDDYFDSLAYSVRKGFDSGTRHEDIAKEIETDYLANGESAAKAKRRAALVARDQVQKLSSELNQERQKAIGVRRYVWRTSKDQRVRLSHRERDGEVFTWDEPIEDQLAERGMAIDEDIEGPPGYPINCRCYSEPVLADLLEDEEE